MTDENGLLPRWFGPAITAGVFAAFAWFLATELYLQMLTHGHSYMRILGWQMLAWFPWVLISPLIGRLGQRAPLIPFSIPNTMIHVALSFVWGVAHIAFYSYTNVKIRPFDAMSTDDFKNVMVPSLSRLHSEMTIYFVVLGLSGAAGYYRQFRAREVEAARLEASLAQSQLQALTLQLHPHFLFNTLHTIGGLVRQQNTDAAIQMISELSDLLRYTLSQTGTEVPLEKEMELIERYTHIQQVRFSDRLTVTIDVAAEVKRCAIPPLILQPLVENAITHGISRSADPGRVEIRAWRENGQLAIDIFNTGPALSRRTGGLGLSNTIERLRRIYGGERLTLRDVSGGVLASIRIPGRSMDETS